MARTRHDFEHIVPMAMNLDEFQLMRNYVIVEYNPKQNDKTPSGIYTPLAATQREVAADYVPRIAKVFKLPKKLYYAKKDMAYSMRWKTEIEIEVGDTVWMNHLTVQDYQFQFKGKEYKIVKYEDLVCAKREKEVIMLNGYILLRPTIEKKKALLYEREEKVVKQAIIEYVGSCNKEYQDPKKSDYEELQVGDKVVFLNKEVERLRFLESDYFLRFDGKPHVVAQRHMVGGILS